MHTEFFLLLVLIICPVSLTTTAPFAYRQCWFSNNTLARNFPAATHSLVDIECHNGTMQVVQSVQPNSTLLTIIWLPDSIPWHFLGLTITNFSGAVNYSNISTNVLVGFAVIRNHCQMLLPPNHSQFNFSEDNIQSVYAGFDIPEKNCFFIPQTDKTPIEFGVYIWSKCEQPGNCSEFIEIESTILLVEYFYQWDQSFTVEYIVSLGLLVIMFLYIITSLAKQCNCRMGCTEYCQCCASPVCSFCEELWFHDTMENFNTMYYTNVSNETTPLIDANNLKPHTHNTISSSISGNSVAHRLFNCILGMVGLIQNFVAVNRFLHTNETQYSYDCALLVFSCIMFIGAVATAAFPGGDGFIEKKHIAKKMHAHPTDSETTYQDTNNVLFVEDQLDNNDQEEQKDNWSWSSQHVTYAGKLYRLSIITIYYLHRLSALFVIVGEFGCMLTMAIYFGAIQNTITDTAACASTLFSGITTFILFVAWSKRTDKFHNGISFLLESVSFLIFVFGSLFFFWYSDPNIEHTAVSNLNTFGFVVIFVLNFGVLYFLMGIVNYDQNSFQNEYTKTRFFLSNRLFIFIPLLYLISMFYMSKLGKHSQTRKYYLLGILSVFFFLAMICSTTMVIYSIWVLISSFLCLIMWVTFGAWHAEVGLYIVDDLINGNTI